MVSPFVSATLCGFNWTRRIGHRLMWALAMELLFVTSPQRITPDRDGELSSRASPVSMATNNNCNSPTSLITQPYKVSPFFFVFFLLNPFLKILNAKHVGDSLFPLFFVFFLKIINHNRYGFVCYVSITCYSIFNTRQYWQLTFLKNQTKRLRLPRDISYPILRLDTNW